MINNCEGCKEELNQAIWYQDKSGLHYATSPDIQSTYPNSRTHLYILMVDDEGEVIIV